MIVLAGLAVGVAAEEEAGGSEEGFEGDDVPGVLGDDVGGEEVDFAGEVGDGAALGAAVGVEVVEAVRKLGGAFHLHAPQGSDRLRRTPGLAGIGLGDDAERGTGSAAGFRRSASGASGSLGFAG